MEIHEKPVAIGLTENEESSRRRAKFEHTKRRFAERFEVAKQSDKFGFVEGLAPFPIRVVINPIWECLQGIHPRTFD